MKQIHNIKITVFVKENEDEEKIKEKLKLLIPLDFEKEKIEIKEEIAEGFEQQIKILIVKLQKQKQIKIFNENLFSKLSDVQINQILDELETRIDDQGCFYLRIDKKTWIDDCLVSVIDEGNCFHIRFKIAAYPCIKEKAIEIMQEFLKKMIK